VDSEYGYFWIWWHSKIVSSLLTNNKPIHDDTTFMPIFSRVNLDTTGCVSWTWTCPSGAHWHIGPSQIVSISLDPLLQPTPHSISSSAPFFHSLSIVLCHVVLGPSVSFFLLVPMSLQRFHHSLDFWSFISISPIIFHLLALTSLLSDFIWAHSSRSSVLISVCLLQWTRRGLILF